MACSRTVAGALSLLLLAPMAALVHGALTLGAGGGVTAVHFTRLFEDTGRISYIEPLQAVRWSLSFAVGATLIALVVGTAAASAIARSRGRLSPLVDGALMLPLAVPAVVLGFGYLTTLNRGWYDLRGSPWIILAAHSLIAYPFVLRSVLAVLRTIDPRLREAARALGASPWRVWRFVELPIATRALLVGAVFAFAVSLGEFGATLLLRRREIATMPIAIFDALGRPGEANLGRAAGDGHYPAACDHAELPRDRALPLSRGGRVLRCPLPEQAPHPTPRRQALRVCGRARSPLQEGRGCRYLSGTGHSKTVATLTVRRAGATIRGGRRRPAGRLLRRGGRARGRRCWGHRAAARPRCCG